ncbi:MAG: hypothetical protein IT422_18595 [Pirellulaceae bacterium]|nr:hypothetical protein [Pirellulaceae bacterium]
MSSRLEWVAEFVVRLGIGSTLLLLTGLLAMAVCRRQSASLRYWIGTWTALALLLLPLAAAALPCWQLGWLDVGRQDVQHENSGQPTVHLDFSEPTIVPPQGFAEDRLISQLGVSRLDKPPAAITSNSTLHLNTSDADVRNQQSPGESPSHELSASQFIAGSSIILFLLIFYALGLGVGLWQLSFAHYAVAQWIRTARAELPPWILQIAEDCRSAMGLSRELSVRLSGRVAVPVVAGMLRPTILLPESAVHWPVERVRAAVAHELAHIERGDLWTQLLSQLVQCIYWPQPLIYCWSRGLCIEREAACDDRVLACDPRPTQYARHLLDVAAELTGRGRAQPAALAMARGTHVERRIAAILSSSCRRAPPARIMLSAMCAGAIIGTLIVASFSPFTALKGQEIDDAKVSAPSTSNEKKLHTFRGRVVFADARPAGGARVRSADAGEDYPSVSTVADANGDYVLALPARNFHPPLIAEMDGELGFAQIAVDAKLHNSSAGLSVDAITLKAAKRIVVEVVDQAQTPVSDAVIYVQAVHGVVERLQTDVLGTATVAYPDGLSLQVIGAVRSRVGCDYRMFESPYGNVDKSHPSQLPQGFEGQVRLVLDGVREATVRVVGPDESPVQGQRFNLWLINRPDRGGQWSLPSGAEFAVETDEHGMARFDMIPHDQMVGIGIWPRLKRTDWFVIGNVGEEYAYINWEKGDTATVHIGKKVLVSGHVHHANGSPAAGISVRAAGGFEYTGRWKETTQSDELGHWEMLVKPNGYYLFVVQNEQFAAQPYAGVIIRDNNLPANLDFALEPSRKVFGRVSGPIGEKTYVMLQQTAADYYELPEKDRLPNSDNGNRGVSAFTQDSVHVAKDGTFEFNVGPGDYTIWSPDKKTQKFSITDELEKEFNFALPRALRGVFTLRAVEANNAARPIANATVVAFGTEDIYRGHLDGVTGLDGTMQVERALVDMLLLAKSSDEQLAGIAKVSADAQESTVHLAPTTSARGRLMDTNGDLLANTKMRLSIDIVFPDLLSTQLETRDFVTDGQGRFELAGMCRGAEYKLWRIVDKDGDGQPDSWNLIVAITPQANRMELGDVRVVPPQQRLGSATPSELAAKAFESDEPLQRRYTSLSQQARQSKQQMLIIAGSPTSQTASNLYVVLSSRDVQRVLASYRQLPIDISGKDKALNRKFLQTLVGREIDVDATELFVLNDGLQVVATTSVAQLQSGTNSLQQALVDFAEQHETTVPRTMTILVTDETGKPLAGADVFRNHVFEFEKDKAHIENQHYPSDASGKALVTLSGTSVDLRLWVTLDGYVPLHAMWAKKFHSDGDKIPDQFTFTMQSGTEIGGMVVDEAGAPIAGAIVEVQEPAVGGLAFGVGRDQPGIRPVRNHYLAEGETALITDVNGRWTLRNVPSDSQLDAPELLPLQQGPKLALRVTLPGQEKDERGYGRLQREQGISHASLRDKSAKFVVSSKAQDSK